MRWTPGRSWESQGYNLALKGNCNCHTFVGYSNSWRDASLRYNIVIVNFNRFSTRNNLEIKLKYLFNITLLDEVNAIWYPIVRCYTYVLFKINVRIKPFLSYCKLNIWPCIKIGYKYIAECPSKVLCRWMPLVCCYCEYCKLNCFQVRVIWKFGNLKMQTTSIMNLYHLIATINFIVAICVYVDICIYCWYMYIYI